MASSPQQPPVGLVASHSIDFVRQVLALLDEGRVVVPLRGPGDTQRMSLAGVTEVREPSPEFGWAAFAYTPRESAETAQFLFTSGTEGLPKGVELPHAALADVVKRLNAVMQVDASIREYIGIPAYHSFGFGRCRAVAAAGGRAYLPEHGFDPLEVADMLRKREINAISAVPSLWRVLLESRSMFADIGAGVRWIEIGSQSMSRDEKLAVRALFPNAKIVQHYGLTEASRSTFLEIHAADGPQLESVGKAYGDVEIGLTDDGRIKIRGPHVATRLWIEGEAQPAVDAQGWYETNDLGSLEDGYLYFRGRADDIINCGGLKLAPELLESRVRALQPTLGDFAIARMPDPVRGDGLLVTITPADAMRQQAIEAAVAEAAAAQGVNARGAIATLTLDSLPRTASGKVQRRKLTERWVADHPPIAPTAAPAPAPSSEGREQELRGIWEEALGIQDIGLDESFYDLGGDSLTALGVIMRMGRAGIDPAICRSIFQGATLRDLVEAAVPQAAAAVTGPDPAAALRAREAELKVIWQEALGTDDIKVDESFYDLGGDSLTALGVIMRMGRAGIDPAICRSIFQGATLRDLAAASLPEPEPEPEPKVALAAQTSAVPEPAPTQKTIGGINASYANNIMVNAVRGILILAVIFGHWSVGVFDRLPASLVILKQAMSPFFLFGTPGFAVTFGIGLGYLQLPVYARNPERVKASMRTGLLIVGSGAVLLGLLGAAAGVFMRHEPMNAHTFWVAFFTPLLFYTLAVASIPAWFALVTKVTATPKQRVRFLLGLAAMSFTVQVGLDVVLEPVKVTGFLQLVRLMLEAKFAYFDMMSLVFVGLALGTWIKHEGTRDDAPKQVARVGSATVGAAVVFGLLTGEIVELTYWPSKNCLTKWVFFSGLVMLVTAWLMRVTRNYSDLAPRVRTLLNAVSTVGQLTLPFYILQSLPIPVKAVLQLLGLPGSVAMLLALAMFFGAAYLMVRRVYAMFHA